MRSREKIQRAAQNPAMYGNGASVWNSMDERVVKPITTGTNSANIATK
jgi:hypothetical protein